MHHHTIDGILDFGPFHCKNCVSLQYHSRNKFVVWILKKAEISIFDLKEPRQNSIDALRDLALFTALDILCMALHILFSSSGPIHSVPDGTM